MTKEFKNNYIIYTADADKVFIDINLDFTDILNYTSNKKLFMSIFNNTIKDYTEISIEDDMKYKSLQEEKIKELEKLK
jgi:hypothetical protein